MNERLPKKFKQKWVKALLSGEYRQCTGSMGYKNHCCVLGVGGIIKFGSPSRGWDLLKNKNIEWQLINLNDQGQVPFEVLAGVIDQWL
jgi:hypothetical protein